MTVYERPYLYPKQQQAIFSKKRWALCEASTKSGKTVASIARLLEWGFAGQPGQNYWWVAPVSDQARIAFARVKAGLTVGSFSSRESPTPSVTLLTGVTLGFKSADNPDCFDEKTEILTDKGWKLFSQLDKTENVLTLNTESLSAEWKKPSRYIAQEYTGKMFRIASGKLDLLVTPNHRFFVNARSSGIGRGMHKRGIFAPPRRDGGYYKFKTIPEMDLSGDRIPARINWIGEELENATLDVCALLGIYLAEGCSAGSFGGTTALENGDYTVHFTQSKGIKGGLKGDVREQLRELFVRLNLSSVKETEDGFFIRSKELWKIFSKLGNCYSKFIPDRIKNLPPEKLNSLMHWMLLGDGTIRHTATSKSTTEKVYYTTSKQLADDFQEIAIKSGYSAIIREKKQAASMLADGRTINPTAILYQVSVIHSDFNYFSDSSECYVSQEDFSGTVYCVETVNSTVLVRRNGRVCWTGNSLYGEDVFGGIMDEASRAKPEAWHAFRSTLTATRGPAVLIGNVKGRKNWFYEFCRRAEAGLEPNASFMRITWRDAVEAGVLDVEEIDDARRNLPENVFKELYEAVATDDTGNPFGEEHIYACVGDISLNKPVAFGIDLAKKQDYFVIIGLDDAEHVCYFQRWQGVPWRDSIRRVHEIVGEDVPALVDSTGIGDPVLEELQYGHGNFFGYNFSLASKQRLMEGLAVAIQSHEIRYPDGPIKSELLNFEYQQVPSGIRYTAAEGHNDDCVCALALARQQWVTTAPGANVQEYMKQEIQRQATVSPLTETRLQNLEFMPWRNQLTIDLDNELTRFYETTLASSGVGPRAEYCSRCGEPVLGPSRVTDGFYHWHFECHNRFAA